jgi:hypothetical protein
MSKDKKYKNAQPTTFYVVEPSAESQTNQERFASLKKQYQKMLALQEIQMEESEKLVASVYR